MIPSCARMPKRTRREKLRADRLRHIHTVVQSPPRQSGANVDEPVQSQTPFTYRMTTNRVTSSTQQVPSGVDLVEFTAIKQDIMKTVFLATIAIGLELLLYFKIGR